MKINKNMVMLILLSILGNIIVYPFLPDAMPHFNFQMQIDGYSEKWPVFLIPLTTVGMYFGLFYLSKLDKRNELNKSIYQLTMDITVLFFILLNLWCIIVSMGLIVNVYLFLDICFGIFFIILGNYLPRVKQNSVFGIRLPWTLSNEVVWKKTHRFGGYMLMLGGFLFLSLTLFSGIMSFIFMLSIPVLIISIVCIVSYVFYRKQVLNDNNHID